MNWSSLSVASQVLGATEWLPLVVTEDAMATLDTLNTHCYDISEDDSGIWGDYADDLHGVADILHVESGVPRAINRENIAIRQRRQSAAYRCYRNCFTEAQFVKYKGLFAPIPLAWAHGDKPMLWRLRREGGVAAVGLLPVIAFAAGMGSNREFVCSQEELSRLIGTGRDSIRRARNMYSEAGIASSPTATMSNGIRLLNWNVGPALTSQLKPDGGRLRDYAYFPMAAVHGGNWARLTPVVQSLYLALIAHSSTFSGEPNSLPFLQHFMKRQTAITDLIAGHQWAIRENETIGGNHFGLRLACLSLRTLSSVTGYSASAISAHVESLKHPEQWPEAELRSGAEHGLVRVYPGHAGAALVFHVRDHASHWPWEILGEGGVGAMVSERGVSES
jgi:hypothetical protein